MRTYGTQAIGIRTPIIREGDDLPNVVTDALLAYCDETGSGLCDRDVIGVTEAVVARAQGNYATVDQIAAGLRELIPSGPVGVVFPIMSRNRFSMVLKGLAAGADSLIIQLSYPADEVGNRLIEPEQLYDTKINPYTDVLTDQDFYARFGKPKHMFTGIDYLELYRLLGNNAKIILANDPGEILKYTKNVIAADIHTRAQTKRRLLQLGADKVIGLDEILTKSVNGSGYNRQYGVLGHNKADETRVKLFPHSCEEFVEKTQALIREKTGVHVEVLVYGDGAFKDPVGGIWELADPVVSPAFTKGLDGLPNEIKLKYIADTEFGDKTGEEARQAVAERIRKKNRQLMGKDESLGTTPRRLSDLVGTLCDLASGSGDKGTPVVLIKGYFDNYGDE
ncbi:MAG: coenzyme F420-0:L-glutamate ligase [Oscillospiraceae bacterium]|nr:coenzyme F420-0:L-glutamate ligase [Oscillospiraceae bacterium]